MSNYIKNFDVIVVGGGHAGTEAALASARTGMKTLLITQNIDNIGQISCNPSIGGVGKGQLVKEIDALGGIMGYAADVSGIQFKTLNISKGIAVQSTRVQVDRLIYKQTIKYTLENQKNLKILQQTVDDLIIKNNIIIGIVTNLKIKIFSKSVVLTTGTFLKGRIYIGLKSYPAGRAGDPASNNLSKKLKNLSFKISRFKTGTPPRINLRTIDYSKLDIQLSDYPLPTFSFFNKNKNYLKQIPCYITYTNEKTHNIIRENIKKSPIYNGSIKGTGPRYCLSIEDKIKKFPERSKHQIFLEPEGLQSNEIYPNGISTSLPFETQIKIINSIKGLEKAQITRPGYAIEYDFINPKDLSHNLESKIIQGLFLAGQINGTTGYEEAGAQGLIAGLNAANFSCKKEGWFPKRDQAYIGVLIDDLCTYGTEEPYRMFTSRAEYRLFLRENNADLRLTKKAYKLNLIDENYWNKFLKKISLIKKERKKFSETWIKTNSDQLKKVNNILKHPIKKKININNLLKRSEINYKILSDLNIISINQKNKEIIQELEAQIKYQGYIKRQNKEIKNKSFYENIKLPNHINYKNILGLSNEAVYKFNLYKPYSIKQASKIPGITISSISILLIWLKKNNLLK